MAAIEALLNGLIAKDRQGKLHNMRWAAAAVEAADGTTLQQHVDNGTDAKHVTAAEKVMLGAPNAAGGVVQLTSENKIPAEYLAGLGSLSTDLEFDDIAERDAHATTDLVSGNTCFVTDATADSTVLTGWAIYRWSGSAWMKIMEQESMDVVVSNNWNDITGKPASTPSEIDGAVTATALRVTDIVTAIPETWPVDVRADGMLFLIEAE